jgi:hypothetical protein
VARSRAWAEAGARALLDAIAALPVDVEPADETEPPPDEIEAAVRERARVARGRRSR